MNKVVVFSAALFAAVAALPTASKCGIVSVAQAQPPEPVNERFVNVTQTVATLVRDNALTFTASNVLTGGNDPVPMVVKKLVLTYVLDNLEVTKAVMEGQTLQIGAPQGKILRIEKALYGDVNFPVVDVTELLRGAEVNNKVSLGVHNQTLAGGGDPAPNKRKRLRVSYSMGGEPKSLTIDEGQNLDLPLRGEPAGALVITSAIYGDLAN